MGESEGCAAVFKRSQVSTSSLDLQSVVSFVRGTQTGLPVNLISNSSGFKTLQTWRDTFGGVVITEVGVNYNLGRPKIKIGEPSLPIAYQSLCQGCQGCTHGVLVAHTTVQISGRLGNFPVHQSGHWGQRVIGHKLPVGPCRGKK